MFLFCDTLCKRPSAEQPAVLTLTLSLFLFGLLQNGKVMCKNSVRLALFRNREKKEKLEVSLLMGVNVFMT